MKKCLREKFLALRNAIPLEKRQAQERELETRLEEFSSLYYFTASFSSTGSEIDLSRINSKLAASGRLLLPGRDANELFFYFVTELSGLTGKRFPEPDPDVCRRADISALAGNTLLLVPALAFSLDHHRLGYGKAFYDRFLARHPEVLSVGVGFLEQLSPDPLPQDSWDIPVKKLILV